MPNISNVLGVSAADINKVINVAEADIERDRMMAMFLANANGRNLFAEYLKSLKSAAEIKITQTEE